MSEKWLPVPGFEGLYEISDQGRVASLPKPTWPGRRILKAVAHKRGGYLYVTLRRDSRQYHRKVHHLVCEAFNGPRPAGTQTRHLDGDHLNNTPGNLVWGSASENGLDRVRHGTHPNAVKTHCKHGHELFGKNLYVNPSSGARQCRICQARAKRDYADREAA